MTTNYKVTARRARQIRVSRHGISHTEGGEVIAVETFQWPDTPYYMAVEMVQDENPECVVAIVAKSR